LSPGSAWTRWGAYSAPPDLLAAFDGSTSENGEKNSEEKREGRGGVARKGRNGKGRCYKPPIENS